MTRLGGTRTYAASNQQLESLIMRVASSVLNIALGCRPRDTYDADIDVETIDVSGDGEGLELATDADTSCDLSASFSGLVKTMRVDLGNRVLDNGEPADFLASSSCITCSTSTSHSAANSPSLWEGVVHCDLVNYAQNSSSK